MLLELKYLFHCEDTLPRKVCWNKLFSRTCVLYKYKCLALNECINIFKSNNNHFALHLWNFFFYFNFFSSTVPAWVHQAIKPVVRALEEFIPQPYAAEIRGMAAFYGSDISDIVLLNFAYEISAYVNLLLIQFVYSINLFNML